MSRIALISDIHGNLVALDAVLAALSRERVDALICLGDVALGGPQPRECVERLRALGVRCVLGNHDGRDVDSAELIDDSRTRALDEIDRWSYAQLQPDQVAHMREFPSTIYLPLFNGDMLLCYHGSPHSNTDIVSENTPEAELARLLGDSAATLYAGGHLHRQMLRVCRDRLVLNAGSVGLPWVYDADGRHYNSQWAAYALVDSHPGALNVELRRLLLDMGAISRAARASGMPHADWWLGQWSISLSGGSRMEGG